MLKRLIKIAAGLICLLSIHAQAIDAKWLDQLTRGDGEAKLEAISQSMQAADPDAFIILEALNNGALHITPTGQAVIINDTVYIDALTGKEIKPAPADLEKVSINNRMRRELSNALSALKLFSPQRKDRLAAAEALQNNPDEKMLTLINRALEKESDEEIKTVLTLTQATFNLKSADPAARLSAVKALSQSSDRNIKIVLAAMLEKNPDGGYAESDEKVRIEAKTTLKALEGRLWRIEFFGNFFSGLSLASVLLLAALGLAITFGLMGIINMAHGELLMIGAYSTYVIQTLFKNYFPGFFDWYLLAAVPFAFLISAIVGMILERTVIRFLYGRPLETLLATWGISLMLIQLVRTIFGAQNVEVANPVWMSGGIHLVGGLVLPYNRIVIIAFAGAVLFMVWAILNRTRLGLFVRAVTQNRRMADCVGVPTNKIDLITFGLGSGIAGLGGCALSQIGNVGPELGQSYIVDSFMVVVLGGVGQLSGTVIAAIGLGEVNKFLEPVSGAVLAKIFVLVFIIIFIQKRPQGLFAMKGRSAES